MLKAIPDKLWKFNFTSEVNIFIGDFKILRAGKENLIIV